MAVKRDLDTVTTTVDDILTSLTELSARFPEEKHSWEMDYPKYDRATVIIPHTLSDDDGGDDGDAPVAIVDHSRRYNMNDIPIAGTS